ncbi:MAG: hypothetical protein R3E96_11590 [Planctomycetota bacterium]
MIACCADHRICVENNATLGVPEVVVGVPFPISALEVMRASVPPQHLRRITLQGPILPPERALAQGLVDSLVDADTSKTAPSAPPAASPPFPPRHSQ